MQNDMRDRLVELIRAVQYLGGLEEKVADHLIENGVVVGSKIKAEAITCWNLFNDECVEGVDRIDLFFDDKPITC